MNRKTIFTTWRETTRPGYWKDTKQMTRQEVEDQLKELFQQIELDPELTLKDGMEWFSFQDEEGSLRPDMSQPYPEGTGFASAMHGNCEGMLIRIYVGHPHSLQSTNTFTIKLFTDMMNAARIAGEITSAFYDGEFSSSGDMNMLDDAA